MAKWTKEDIKRLSTLYKEGKTSKEIAATMKRSFASVTQKVYNLQHKGVLKKKHSSKEVKKKKTSKVNTTHLRAALGNTYKKYEPSVDEHKHDWSVDEDSSSFKISKTMTEITTFLLSKNQQYGDSALQPIRIFSTADKTEQIKVRIDDKLNRLMQGNASLESDEDVVKDLIGYLVLLLVHMKE